MPAGKGPPLPKLAVQLWPRFFCAQLRNNRSSEYLRGDKAGRPGVLPLDVFLPVCEHKQRLVHREGSACWCQSQGRELCGKGVRTVALPVRSSVQLPEPAECRGPWELVPWVDCQPPGTVSSGPPGER